ncbi:hypothetical protein HDA40_003532 [Hamadaea flava]|uniref:DUF1345 domain-containing protein n=1 Tax=Hamadaea flava TaxID=1742688 RepID=A0ABV8LJ43_9ACTN|nr:hypothetical protein [Hamadaea flava]MCP2325025.1 hypothetical protein [Hamadaea flava]
MAALDPRAEISLHTTGEWVTVELPLLQPVTGVWARQYERLARAAAVPADVHTDDERAWIEARLPAISRPEQVSDTLNAARDLVARTDPADGSPIGSPAETSIRVWWSNARPESPWPMMLTLAVAIGVQFALPSRFSLGPDWIVPAILVALAGAHVIVDHVRFGRRALLGRILTIGIATILVANGAGVTFRLIDDLISGGPETNSPGVLLGVGFGVWIYTVIVFAFLYWVLDGGGASARAVSPARLRDLAFPQHLNSQVSGPGWRPKFLDYLYLGFTNATAFSPTDVMPLALWAKLAMTVQAITSLAILGLVVARAVNILQ